MAGGTFVIQEMQAIGGNVEENSEGERFTWTAAKKNIPRRPWALPKELRIVRTDYPSSLKASAQVLGAKQGPSTLDGRWDDRYNTPGYAKAEFDRFNDMIDRGNPVRIYFQELIYEGLISNLVPKYHRADYIEYEFTFDNYGPPGDREDSNRQPTTIASADQEFDDTSFVVQTAIDTNQKAPASAMNAGDKKGVDDLLRTMSANVDKLGQSIDTRRGVLKPISEFSKLATMFRIIGGDASNVINRLITVRSDTELAIRTAISVLDYEAWSRTLRTQMRILKGQSSKGARSMEERAGAKATQFYRPRKGESLYHISRKVYGTPHGWRSIQVRNRISYLQMTGDELLIIPERSAG